jgi:hypothetical protein
MLCLAASSLPECDEWEYELKRKDELWTASVFLRSVGPACRFQLISSSFTSFMFRILARPDEYDAALYGPAWVPIRYIRFGISLRPRVWNQHEEISDHLELAAFSPAPKDCPLFPAVGSRRFVRLSRALDRRTNEHTNGLQAGPSFRARDIGFGLRHMLTGDALVLRTRLVLKCFQHPN